MEQFIETLDYINENLCLHVVFCFVFDIHQAFMAHTVRIWSLYSRGEKKHLFINFFSKAQN